MKQAGILGFLMLSMVKFLFAPSMMTFAPGDYSIFTVLITTTLGAALGTLLFYFFGMQMFRWIGSLSRKRTEKKTFTPMRRKILSVKNKYGIKGLMLLSGIISVPVTALLAAKYFGDSKQTPLYLILGFFIWSIFLTSISFLAKHFIYV
ncbi:MAG: hypothetical protein ACPGWM_04680 [Flavobacteriales bacterium]